MQSFIISHSTCAEQYGDMSADTQIHTHTDTHTDSLTHTQLKHQRAGVQLVGHTSNIMSINMGVTKSQAFRAHDVTCNMRTGAAPLMHSIAAQYERVPKLA